MKFIPVASKNPKDVKVKAITIWSKEGANDYKKEVNYEAALSPLFC